MTDTYKMFKCNLCDHEFKLRPQSWRQYRRHVEYHHPKQSDADRERHLVNIRYPHIDIDKLIKRYENKLETMIGLQYQGIFIKKFLYTIGVARHHNADKSIMRAHKKLDMTKATKADVLKGISDLFNQKTEKAPMSLDTMILKATAILLEKGQDELIPVKVAELRIKHAKDALASQIEALRKSMLEPEDIA